MESDKRTRLANAESALEEVFSFIYPGDKGRSALAGLLNVHGSPSAVIEAGSELLEEEGLSEDNALLLSIIPDMLRHIEDMKWGYHPRLTTIFEAEKYMRLRYRGMNVESYHLLALDSSARLIECVHLHTGNENSVPFYLKKVMSAVIKTNADMLVLCHNHPSCIARPSSADIECTEKLMRAVAQIGAPLLDHMIMIGDHALSMRGFGFIKEDVWLRQAPDSVILFNWLDSYDCNEYADLLNEYEKY